METLHALYKVTAGIDVHRMVHAVTVLIEHDDGHITKEQRPSNSDFMESSQTSVSSYNDEGNRLASDSR
jgi:hypothetical protein